MPQDKGFRARTPDQTIVSNNNNDKNGLVRIMTYQQFQPVLRKSANIQEKIAIFSGKPQPASLAGTGLNPGWCNSSTTGKSFPILRPHHEINKVICPAISKHRYEYEFSYLLLASATLNESFYHILFTSQIAYLVGWKASYNCTQSATL